jgi:hypothetical protein
VGHGAWPFWVWEDRPEGAATEGGPIATPLTLTAEKVDEVVPFPIDRVVAALKPAMESRNCKVKEETPGRIECKRPHGDRTGGESVTALLEAQGGQTHVSISTGKGF